MTKRKQAEKINVVLFMEKNVLALLNASFCCLPLRLSFSNEFTSGNSSFVVVDLLRAEVDEYWG